MIQPSSGMNGYEFTASMFKSLMSLGWPAAAAWATWLFKNDLTKLLPRLHVKRGELEVMFDEELDKAEAEIEQLPPPSSNQSNADLDKDLEDQRKRLDALIEISPRAAVLNIRYDLEQSVRKLAKSMDIDTLHKSHLQLMRSLREKNALSAKHYDLLQHLRTIGNKAAHNQDYDVTAEEAFRYGDLAGAAMRAIDDLAFMLG